LPENAALPFEATGQDAREIFKAAVAAVTIEWDCSFDANEGDANEGLPSLKRTILVRSRELR
jgi:hypothetical protein